MTPKLTEKMVQRAIIQWAQLRPRLLWLDRQNTGAAKYSTRKRVTFREQSGGAPYTIAVPGKTRFVRFGAPGQGDLCGVMRGGQHIEIECKGHKGRQTAEQRTREANVLRMEGLYILARSLDDVLAALKRAGYDT